MIRFHEARVCGGAISEKLSQSERYIWKTNQQGVKHRWYSHVESELKTQYFKSCDRIKEKRDKNEKRSRFVQKRKNAAREKSKYAM